MAAAFRPGRVEDGQPKYSLRIVYQLYDDFQIGKNELLVLLAILRFADWTSREAEITLDEIMGRGKGRKKSAASRLNDPRTVRSAIKRLMTLGVLLVTPQRGRPPLYRVVVPGPSGGSPDPSHAMHPVPVGDDRQEHGMRGDPSHAVLAIRDRDIATTEEKTKTSSLPSPVGGPVPGPGTGARAGAAEAVAAAEKPESHGLRLVKQWAESFQAHFGKRCVILWGRDVGLMNKVVTSYGPETTEKMLHAFWRFRVKTGKPVTIPTFYGVADRVYFDVKDGGRADR